MTLLTSQFSNLSKSKEIVQRCLKFSNCSLAPKSMQGDSHALITKQHLHSVIVNDVRTRTNFHIITITNLI